MKLNPTQLRPSGKVPSKLPGALLTIAAGIWKTALSVLRSARVQRRVRVMQLVERVALGNKQSIVLVRVDKQEYVVGCCGDSLVLLGSRKPGPEKARRRRTESITAQITNQTQLLCESQPKMTRRPKAQLRGAQSSDQALSIPESQPAKTSSQKAKPSKALPPTKAQLLKSFAGRIQ
jgi:flagellar biogenesis protein FliO